MTLKQLSFINQNIYQAYLTDINNFLLLQELDTFYLNLISSSQSSDMRFPDAGPESQKLRNNIDQLVSIVAGKNMLCREFWMFSMRNNGSVPRHNHKTNYQLHPEEYYSIVYYPCANENSAKLNFIGNICNTLDILMSVKPETGMLLIFNSFIDHYTDKHMSDDQRTCISANYKPEEPNKSLVSDWTRFAKPGVAEDSRLSKFS